jgi:hypothetical protein
VPGAVISEVARGHLHQMPSAQFCGVIGRDYLNRRWRWANARRGEHLKAQLAVLRRARFGRSSEKLDREIEQLKLVLGSLRNPWRKATPALSSPSSPTSPP